MSMDDTTERHLRIHVGDTEYDAAPLTDGQVIAIQQLRSVSASATTRMLAGVMKGAIGEDQYNELMVEMALGTVGLKQVMNGLEGLITATVADSQAKAEEAKAAVRAAKAKTASSTRHKRVPLTDDIPGEPSDGE